MSTSQRPVMLCGWGVNAGMACLQVKLCVAISERFGNAIGLVIKGTLQMSRFPFTLLTNITMWANAQRDGRSAEHMWCPLFNAAKFG